MMNPRGHMQPYLSNSLAIRQEIQRFESVHPSIYAIYDLIEQRQEFSEHCTRHNLTIREALQAMVELWSHHPYTDTNGAQPLMQVTTNTTVTAYLKAFPGWSTGQFGSVSQLFSDDLPHNRFALNSGATTLTTLQPVSNHQENVQVTSAPTAVQSAVSQAQTVDISSLPVNQWTSGRKKCRRWHKAPKQR